MITLQQDGPPFFFPAVLLALRIESVGCVKKDASIGGKGKKLGYLFRSEEKQTV